MAIVDVTIAPRTEGAGGLSKYVAECHKVLKESGLKHMLTPMSTIIEGDLDEILKVVRQMQEKQFEMGALRVNTTIRIDDRRDIQASMEQKLNSVKSKL